MYIRCMYVYAKKHRFLKFISVYNPLKVITNKKVIHDYNKKVIHKIHAKVLLKKCI